MSAGVLFVVATMRLDGGGRHPRTISGALPAWGAVRSRYRFAWAIAIVCLALLLAGAPAAHGVAQCPISYGMHDDAKPNKLYLYYPNGADMAFPEFGLPGAATSPADPFDTTLLTSFTGTAAALQSAVSDVVIDDYCEFNVQVRSTTTAPPTTFARRNVVAVSTADNTASLFGVAEAVDAGDATAVDRARVWAGRYQSQAGGAGGALNGANSTTARWANSIGGTAAHEGGHNYGLTHAEGALVGSGEDALTRHIMPAGTNLTDEQRASFRRHFNDANFATLAGNVGLSIQTMHNWDLVNPNAQTARQFRLTFLSPQTSPIVSWSYADNGSPWINPTLSSSLGTQTFKGTTYNRFQLTWSTGQSWSGGASGQVPGGVRFHTGATFSGVDFNQPDPIIITRSELLDASGNPLVLQPRLVAYDNGTADASDGSFDIDFTNTTNRPLKIRDMVVRLLPRVQSLEAMVRGGPLVDWSSRRFRAFRRRKTILRGSRPLSPRGRRRDISVTVAKLRPRRQVLDRITRSDCEIQDRHTPGRDVGKCNTGYNVSLFPATTLNLTATVVQPRARRWNRRLRRYVVGPLRSRIFYQLGGIHPDLNRNRVDDAVDIASRRSRDRNRDGVPDEAQRPPR